METGARRRSGRYRSRYFSRMCLAFWRAALARVYLTIPLPGALPLAEDACRRRRRRRPPLRLIENRSETSNPRFPDSSPSRGRVFPCGNSLPTRSRESHEERISLSARLLRLHGSYTLDDIEARANNVYLQTAVNYRPYRSVIVRIIDTFRARARPSAGLGYARARVNSLKFHISRGIFATTVREN